MFHEGEANTWLVKGIICVLWREVSVQLLTECADSIKIGAYVALLCCYHAVSAVHMRSKCLIRDKRMTVYVLCKMEQWYPRSVSKPNFLVELQCLWKTVCWTDVLIWGFWHAPVIIDVLWVVSLLWYISLAAVTFQWWWSVAPAGYFLLCEHIGLCLS